ncbi:MAG: ABC transporter permease [Cyclobacteriaceae bacterium]|nr:ABC transporter permease [Cyclobacteriaceae bacterium]
MKQRPPAAAQKLLQRFLRSELAEEVLGDLEEKFYETNKARSVFRARLNYWYQVVNYLRPFAIKKFKTNPPNSADMFQSYLKIGWRNLFRNSTYSIINISGLALGMAVALLIGLWVFDELSFNTSFKNHSRIAAVYHHIEFGEDKLTIGDVSPPMGPELKATIAELDEATITTWPKEHIVDYENAPATITGLFVEPVFAEIFSLEMYAGSATALKEIHSVLLSQSTAEKIIGSDAIGKTFRLNNRDNMLVAGVYKDFPANSEFANVQMLLPMNYYIAIDEGTAQQMTNWEDLNFQCFVLLNETASLASAEAKMKSLLFTMGSNDIKAIKPEGLLLPMSRWHLYNEYKNGVPVETKANLIWMFGMVGVFVLLLACINFMNLSTARSERRAREVGVRKVMGSVRSQLVNQFLSESLLVVVAAFGIALMLAWFSLPWFNTLTAKQITFPWNNLYFIATSILFIAITSLLAGSYPAFYLSGFNPVKVLKGTFKTGEWIKRPRQALVVFQFSVSVILVLCTGVVFQQIQHAKNRPVGFLREGVFFVAIRTHDLSLANYNSLRTDVLATGYIQNMAKSFFPITGSMSADASLTWQGKDPAFRPLIALNSCSHDFPSTNGFEFVAGRDFSRAFSTDSTAVIVNEMAAKLFGDDVIGKKINFASGIEREIVGVIKDQVRWSPFTNQSPHMYFIKYEEYGFLTFRLVEGASVQAALTAVKEILKKYDQAAPFEYKFVDEDYGRLFHNEERIGKLATVFATLAIVISGIGLLGLSAFAASQRTKEIGIRKVLGASVFQVWKLLSQDFLKLILLALLAALPLGYYLADSWLTQYEYRTEISWWLFAVVAIAAVILMMLTVSHQSLKAANTNPVKTLRAE